MNNPIYRKGMRNPDLNTNVPAVDWGRAVQQGAQTAIAINQNRRAESNAIVDRNLAMEKLPYELQKMEQDVQTSQANLAIRLAKMPLEMEQKRLTNEAKQLEISDHSAALFEAQTKGELSALKIKTNQQNFNNLYGGLMAEAIADFDQNQNKEKLVQKYSGLMTEIDGLNDIPESGRLFRQAYINAETEVEAVTGQSYWEALPKITNEKGEIVPDDSPAARSATAESVLNNPNSTPAQQKNAQQQHTKAAADEKKELSYAVKKKIYDIKQDGIKKGVSEDNLDEYVTKRRRIEELGGPNGEAQGLSEMASVSRDYAMAVANDFITEYSLDGKFKELDGQDAFDKFIGTIKSNIDTTTEDMSDSEKKIFHEQLGIQFLDAQIESLKSSVTRAQSEFNQEMLKVGSDPNKAFNIGVNNFGGSSISKLTSEASRGAWIGTSDAAMGIFTKIGALGGFYYETVTDKRHMFDAESAGAVGWGKSGSKAYSLTRNELDSAVGYLENLKQNPDIDPVYHVEIEDKILALTYAKKKLEFGASNTPKIYESFVGKIRGGAEGLYESTTDVASPTGIRTYTGNIKLNINSLMGFTFQLPQGMEYNSPYRTSTGGAIRDLKSQQELQIKILREERNQRVSALGASMSGATDSGTIGERNRGNSNVGGNTLGLEQ